MEENECAAESQRSSSFDLTCFLFQGLGFPFPPSRLPPPRSAVPLPGSGGAPGRWSQGSSSSPAPSDNLPTVEGGWQTHQVHPHQRRAQGLDSAVEAEPEKGGVFWLEAESGIDARALCQRAKLSLRRKRKLKLTNRPLGWWIRLA